MSNLKRYQNPELFEQLAIEYALGSLHGRSRRRFEILMETHFYLRAVVEAYENIFAYLVELLPEEHPSIEVWNNIETHIKSSPKTQAINKKLPWWNTGYFKRGLGLATMTLIVTTVLLFNPMSRTPTVSAYNAVLESDSNELIAITKIKKSDMKLSIELIKPVLVSYDMELVLWCHPKRGGMPMKMGTVFSTGRTEIKISQNEWQNMKDVGILAISVERKDKTNIREPSGEPILIGHLKEANIEDVTY
ncbi:hypothetical protein [uncultured Cocleimonas sp.]|uniref:anti-sigma factor n=1 Tax=uncultured Cocleimonas sp. TaxID=1051587 RepID=UPI00261969E5|nr:hypothetical protein [uncultured Cocleimonas sp.]